MTGTGSAISMQREGHVTVSVITDLRPGVHARSDRSIVTPRHFDTSSASQQDLSDTLGQHEGKRGFGVTTISRGPRGVTGLLTPTVRDELVND